MTFFKNCKSSEYSSDSVQLSQNNDIDYKGSIVDLVYLIAMKKTATF